METLSKIKELTTLGVNFVSESGTEFTNWITKKLRAMDSWFRRRDRNLAYTYGPKKNILLKAEGHFFMISLILVFLLTFLILGPNLDSLSRTAILVLSAAYALALFIPLKLSKPDNLFWYQAGLLTIISLIIWFVFSDGHIQRDGKLYQHILFPAFGIILIGLLFARSLARLLLQSYQYQFFDQIKKVELFYSTRKYPLDVSYKAFIRNILTTPFYYPLKLVFFPAIFILIIADRNLMMIIALVVLLASFFYLAAASVHERLHYLLEMLDDIFFKGGHLVLSIIVVALAAGRLAGESHITTLIESDPDIVNLTIVRYILMTYVLFSFFEYWANRHLLERFVLMFTPENSDHNPGQVKFDAEVSSTDVAMKNRVLQAQGNSRLIVIGKHKDTRADCWHTYTRVHLLDTIFNKSDYKCYEKAQIIKQRMRFYFLALNLYLLLAVVGMTLFFAALPQKAEVSASITIKQEQKNNLFNLQERLFINNTSDAKDPLILLAASGGGTRAAIYAESVLRGLKHHELLDQIVLTSSVSGGSAAMAYFGAYRNELINGDAQRWEIFSNTMAMPFIQDVLEGIVDWRIVAGVDQPNDENKESYEKFGFRLGELLAESFEHRFKLIDKQSQKFNKIGAQDNFGMIFNTAIVAKFPRWNCSDIKQNQPWEECLCSDKQTVAVLENKCSYLRTSLGQGGRLIFTNLQDLNGFPDSGKPMKNDEYLTYIKLQDPTVKLTHAAALSANFPPVFPNAAVDIDQQRYWVTDGGASDNRGILSLLYALKNAINQEQVRCENPGCAQSRRPALHVIVAEASAVSLAFSRSSGLSAMFGAPARFASQLMVDMANEIQQTYKEMGGEVYFHYLAMPMIFRSDGGLSTHWMLPSNVKFEQPLGVKRLKPKLDDSAITLTGEETRHLVDQLHNPKQSIEKDDELTRLWQWIDNDLYSNHQATWDETIQCIKGDCKP